MKRESPEYDALILLAPPTRLCVWLDKVFAQKRAKGEEVPAAFTAWLKRWDCIRSSEAIPILDELTPEGWRDLVEAIEP
jgi:hypothetical protein